MFQNSFAKSLVNKSFNHSFSLFSFSKKNGKNTRRRDRNKKCILKQEKADIPKPEKCDLERTDSWETISSTFSRENSDTNAFSPLNEIEPTYTSPELWEYSCYKEFVDEDKFSKIIGENIIQETEDNFFVKKYIQQILTTKELSLIDIEEVTKFIVSKKAILEQQNLTHIKLDNNVTMIGDIHGDLDSMIFQIIVTGGFALGNKILFLGDYLDRGPNGIECMYLLFLLRFLFPNQMYFLRGNHEDVKICAVYGVTAELYKKQIDTNHISKFLEFFEELFTMMPICAEIGKIIFAVHGCVSEHTPLEAINNMDKVKNLPESSKGDNHIFTNMLWSDPLDDLRCNSEKTDSFHNYRGEGYLVPKNVTKEFLSKYGYSVIVRAHQVVNEGYLLQHDNTVITLFGQPNYCQRTGNKAAYMTIQKTGKTDIVQFSDRDVAEFTKKFTEIKQEEKGDKVPSCSNIALYFS
jgi:hypothetical protein